MQEKLQHFYEVSVESAREEAKAELEAYQAELEKDFSDYQVSRQKMLETDRRLEQENVKRQMNKEISREQLEIRRRMSQQMDEKKRLLFDEVKEKLQNFRKQPEYREYLYQKFRRALDFAGHDEIQLLLSSGDADCQEELVHRLSHPITVLNHDFGGGACAVIISRNLQIDDSFITLLETERQEFVFGGGSTHG